jgi:Prophage tail length tape measure protein
MDTEVKYTVTANDLLSRILQGMNANAKALEGTMGGLSTMVKTLGVGFSVFQGLNFVKEGIHKFEELHQAMAQVEAGLESTGGAAGMTMESITAMASEMSSKMKFGKTDLMDMSAQMLTFGGLTKENFPAIGEAIANVATRIGMDLHGMSIQFGKAMDNPSEGIRKLSRQGVLFSKQQSDQIDALVAKGNIVAAQQIMLTEIQNKYGGSAEAAFNADPLAKFSKMMGSLRMAVGEAAMELLKTLMPSIELIAKGFKDLGGWIKNGIHWLKEHQEITGFLKITLGSMVAMIITYNAVQKISALYTAFTTTSMIAQAFSTAAITAGFAGASTSGMIWAGVMGVVNAVMALNPVMLVVIAIGLLIGAIYEVVKHFHEWGAAVTLMMGPLGWLVSAIMSIYGHWQSIKDAFQSDGIIGGLKRIGIVLMDTMLYPLQQLLELASKIPGVGNLAGAGAKKILEMRKSLDLVLPEETAKKDNKLKEKPKGLASVKPMSIGEVGKEKKDKSSGVTGSKSVTINVTIGNLVNEFTVKTTNITEGSKDIKDKIAMVLTSALNDSQIIAGQS